jgi:RNA polymerase sigma-70 factor, ECF subfamily
MTEEIGNDAGDRQATVELEERELIQRTLRGDQSAFTRLVDRFRTPIYNLCYRMLGSGGDAEDAAQETFLRAYTQLHTYQAERKFSTWLFAIASHLCIDVLRRRRYPLLPLDTVALWKQSNEPQPEEQVLSAESNAEVRTLLKLLPEKYRLVVVLRYWQDLSYAEIAAATDLSESAVKTQLHRARRMLADYMMKRKEAQGHAVSSVL